MARAVMFCLIATIAGMLVHFATATPPVISIPQGNSWPQSFEYVRKSTNKVVQCRAQGNPPPTYMWLVNGTEVQARADVVTYNKTSGDLKIGQQFYEAYTGDYQCIAYNENGKAMTPFLKLIATIAQPFAGQSGTSPTPINAYETEYKTIECTDVPLSIPPWNIKWQRGRYDPVKKAMAAEDIYDSNRMVIDPSGTLHLLWVEMSDNGYIYSCSGENIVIKLEVKDTKSYSLNVIDSNQDDRAPELKYQKDITVRVGDDAELSCIFTYYSRKGDPLVITWIYKGNLVLNARGEPYQGGTLKIPNVEYPTPEKSQEGEYMCNATVGQKSVQGKVNLKIVAPPKFVEHKDLAAVSTPVGKDAVFQCEATSHQSYIRPPVWFVNAEPILGCPPRQFECTQRKAGGYSNCIPESSRCNSIPECPDDSDEMNCNTGGSCVEGMKYCNGGCISKESICSVSCLEGLQECNGVCISKDVVCTPLSPCTWPGFSCRDNSGCLSREKKCNGVKDCKDGSDEEACPGGQSIQINRFQINSQRSQITLPQVKLSDTMCIQCMVTNDYGTLVGDGCLTVIQNIRIVYGPNDTYAIEPGMYLNIGVEAITDPNWQKHMKYEWIWYRTIKDENNDDVVETETLPPKKFGQFFQLSQEGKNLTIHIPEVDPAHIETYDIYDTLKDARYEVVIAHTFDKVTLDFQLIGEDILPPVPDKVVVQSAGANLWFIALILAILILFIVVALIICYMYRNRGGTYPLDKKEHQAGHDPEQELKDSGFHDVGRIGDDYGDDRKPDEVSLSESVKPYESDEDITEEYGGDFDVSKFNEDGSFIGLYGDKKSKYSGAKEATV